MFMATLDYYASSEKEPWINPRWGAYIIGFFVVERAPIKQKEFQLSAWAGNRFQNNAHFRRINKEAHLWIAGSLSQSKLLKKAFPLSSPNDSFKPNELAHQTFLADYLKTNGWYRWTLSCIRKDQGSDFLSALKTHDCEEFLS